jgi:hypothetical protein
MYGPREINMPAPTLPATPVLNVATYPIDEPGVIGDPEVSETVYGPRTRAY